MVKFQNRVAHTEINRFIETSPLIIFFNGKNDNSNVNQEEIQIDLRKKIAKYLVDTNLSSNISQKKNYNLSEMDLKDLKDLKDLLDLHNKGTQIKYVKNNYMKKALDKKLFFNCKGSTFALPQGNNLAIALQVINFFLLKDLKEQFPFPILGAIYKNSSIDHNQLLQLSRVIKEDQIYYNLNNNIRNSLSNVITLINRSVSTNCTYTLLSNNIYMKFFFVFEAYKEKLRLKGNDKKNRYLNYNFYKC